MSYFGFGIFFTVRRHIAIGVEHRLGAVDDLRGADQQARLYRLPVDLAEVRAGLGKHVFQIKILLACAKTRQAATALMIMPYGLRPRIGAFTPSTGNSVSSALSAPYVNKFSKVSVPGLATKSSQKRLSLSIASSTEPRLPLTFGTRPYQTIRAHRAPADVPLTPTSSNRFRSLMSSRISVRTPISKAACIPPPWQATATLGMALPLGLIFRFSTRWAMARSPQLCCASYIILPCAWLNPSCLRVLQMRPIFDWRSRAPLWQFLQVLLLALNNAVMR